MPNMRKFYFGTAKNPIEVEWDTYKIHKCTYSQEDVEDTFNAVVKPNVEKVYKSCFDRYNLREAFRCCLNASDKDNIQVVLNILMAFRLMKIDNDNKAYFVYIDDECAEHLFRNIIFNMNHFKTSLLNRICKTVIANEYHIPITFYYMGSEYDNDRLNHAISYDENLLYKSDFAKRITKEERARKKAKKEKEEEKSLHKHIGLVEPYKIDMTEAAVSDYDFDEKVLAKFGKFCQYACGDNYENLPKDKRGNHCNYYRGFIPYRSYKTWYPFKETMNLFNNYEKFYELLALMISVVDIDAYGIGNPAVFINIGKTYLEIDNIPGADIFVVYFRVDHMIEKEENKEEEKEEVTMEISEDDDWSFDEKG